MCRCPICGGYLIEEDPEMYIGEALEEDNEVLSISLLCEECDIPFSVSYTFSKMERVENE